MSNPNFSARKFAVNLAAGGTLEIAAEEYVALIDATGTLEISSEGAQFVPFGVRRGFRAKAGGKIGRLTVKNPSGVAISGTIITGIGDYIDFQAVTLAHDPLPVTLPAAGQAVIGKEADGAAAASAPVLTAGKSGDGKVRTVQADTQGRVVSVEAVPADMADGAVQFTVTTPLDVIATPGAGKRLIVGLVTIANDGIVDDVVILYDDATEKLRVAVKAGTSYVLPFKPGLRVTVNKALRADVVTGGGSVRVFATATVITP